MMPVANTAQIREADNIQINTHQVPGIILMEEAGKQATEHILAIFAQHTSFLVLAGPGNNGGDGLVIARYLYLAGKQVKVMISHPPERYKGDALINYRICRQLPIEFVSYLKGSLVDVVESFSEPPLVIDALLGTGVKAALRPPISDIIAEVKVHDLMVAAIDLPSGLSADSGEVINDVLDAAHTFTFQLPKLCHYITPAALTCGLVTTIDIGIWPAVIQELGIRRFLLDESFLKQHKIIEKPSAHKGDFGHVLVIGGSRDMAGAPTMSALAAVKSGVGLCTVLTPGSCRQTVFNHCPEAMCIGTEAAASFFTGDDLPAFRKAIKGKTAVAIGPGMGTHPETQVFLEAILREIEVPMIIDADALNMLAHNPGLWESIPNHTVLTPHPGEMARLTGGNKVKTQRLEINEQLAKDKQVISVLKGAGTLVSTPNGYTYINSTGNPGMATGGSGDVLTGIIGSLLAQGYGPSIAAALGVYIHGKAGDIAAAELGREPLTATRIAHHITFNQ